MTTQGGHEVWVTFAEDEETAIKALVLAKSLRRVKTSKKILITVGPSVSNKTWKHLEIVFDWVVVMDTEEASSECPLSFQQLARLSAYKMTTLRTAFVLDPNVLFLENCDEIFNSTFEERDESFGANVWKKEDVMDLLNRPIIAVSPSRIVYNGVKAMLAGSERDLLHLPRNFTLQNENTATFLSKYGLNLDMEKDAFAQWKEREEDLKFVNFVGKHPLTFEGNHGSINGGSLEKSVLELWNELHSSVRAFKDPALMRGIPQEMKENEPIAIVGMSCRFPGANNVAEFWNLLLNKGDGIVKVPKDRWLEEQCPNIDPDAMEIQAGFLKCPVDEFDAKLFGMNPMELSFTDPQQRFLLELSWEALEDAAINPQLLNGSNTGIFTGTWTRDYNNMMIHNALRGGGEGEFFRSYMGNAYGATAGRMAHFFGTVGSNIATESGCSSSIVAVGLACKSLRRKETNLALACGVNLLLHPFNYNNMGAFISPDGHCKAFDAKADGFGRAEGCGVLVLKRLSDAVKDGDRIHAVIRGYGEAQEGPSKSLGTPTVAIEALAMKIALADAEVEPNQIQFVESHGTGTAVGDPMEMEAIAQVYSKDRKEPLYVGSVKTNVGHTESCSGITGIIKTVLALKNETIPPHRALEELNPKIDLSKTQAIIPMEPIAWKRTKGQKRMAGVSSFGITGTDAHLILEEAPILNKIWAKAKGKLPMNILALSAKTEDCLNDLIKAYGKHLEQNLGGLTDVAFTANTGRAHFNGFRAAIVGKDCPEILKKIGNGSFLKQGSVSGSKPKLCFLFTGQGSQYHKMGRTLYENAPEFRKNFDLCEEILTKSHGIEIRGIIWGEKESDLLHRTLYSQTSIFCIEYCLTKLWESWGIIPDTVVGHSLGEFAAACAAGILSLNGALTLVAERSKLIDSLLSGKMIVVKADLNKTNNLLKQLSSQRENFMLDIAAMNSPDQTALAGSAESIEEFKTFCANNGIKSHELDATHAFHSRQMDPILPAYRKVAESIKYGKPTCEFISGMEGKLLSSIESEYWVQHTRESVNFVGASKVVYSEGCRMFLEVGPQPILSAFIQTNLASEKESVKCFPSLRKKQDEWETILEALASLYVNDFDPNWNNFFKYVPTQKVSLPFYQFQRKKYWFELSKNGIASNKFGGKELHPLIGCAIPNATSTHIFQVNLELEKEAWVKDHMLGKHVIFPGAGYLEMCLASGHASSLAGFEDFHMPYHPVVLQNLKIEAVLGIKEGELCEIQTVVSLDEEANIEGESCWNKISIYRQHGESSGAKKWMKHASATFSSIVMDPKAKETQDFATLKKDFKVEVDVSEFYEVLEKVGLNFGPSFRSIKKVWTMENGERLVQIQVPSQPDNKDRFLCHPVVIDAMLQAGTIKDAKNWSLSVPILIRQFIWLGKSEEIQNTNYIHIYEELKEESESDSIKEIAATLYSEDGKTLAKMQGMTLVTTSVESITNALESQKIVLPRMFEEKWRPESKYEPFKLNEEDFLMSIERVKEMTDSVEIYAPLQEPELSDQKMVDEIVPSYGMKSFQELGWSPRVGEQIELDEFIQRLGITPQNKLLTRRFFEMFCEDGFCSQIGPMEFIVLKGFPSLPNLQSRIKFLLISVEELKLEMECLVSGLVKLTDVLQGKDDVLSILFGEGDGGSLAERIYRDLKIMSRVNELFSRSIEHVLMNWFKNKMNGKELRILEIGAGTGSATQKLLPLLQKHKINYSYTFTDLSGMFFVRAESTFSAYKEHMHYKVLDIEKDPKAQGFAPNQFDIVVAVNVLHATKSLTKTLQNVRHLMKPRGLVFVVEHFAPQRMIDGGFGLLEGYWIFEDFESRPYHALASEKTWMDLLGKNGFETSTVLKVTPENGGIVLAQASNQIEDHGRSEESEKKSWIIFAPTNDCPISASFESKIKSSGKSVYKIEPGQYFNKIFNAGEVVAQNEIAKDFKNVIERVKLVGEIEGFIYLWGVGAKAEMNFFTRGYLNLIQSIISTRFPQKQMPKLIVVSEGVMNVGDQEPGSPFAGTLWGMSRTLRSEHPTMIVRCVDLDPSESSTESKVSQAFTELWKEDQDFMVAYRSGIRHVCRLIDIKLKRTPLALPNSQRFILTLPPSKAVSDLRFGTMGRTELKENMIEIRVKAAGLNFRDLFSVLKPVPEFDKSHCVGADFAGVITALGPDVKNWKIGDAVFGCNFQNQPLPSHIILPEDTVVSLPNGMTFAEGSTLATVFATVYHCLIDHANLQKGETILIHTASGGVGLIAIQLAKDIGAKIIATAGSRKKRAYLRSLGLEHVFHSRDLSFGEEIKRVTGGKGVQMVLNSLTGPGFKETSLNVCAPNARFVEMSKLNIWTEEEVKTMRPDVKFTVVDLTAVPVETWIHLFTKLEKYLAEGRVQPIQYVRFDSVEIREALTYLQKARHIGKIVCIMPEVELVNGQWEANHEMFNDRSTYLITGGLGGIGLEAAKWMAKQGAKHIVLCGRSEPSQKAQDVIKHLNNSDKNVLVMKTDVGSYEACVQLLNKIRDDLPPLRGIMHAAGTLSDAMVENQSWEKYEHTFKGKVNGALNLHNLTKDYLLEHFVMYSSAASILGSLGQSNHAAGNAFLDCLAQYRNNISLPATSINWGQWGQVGVAAELEVPGIYPFTPLQAFNALELALKSHKNQVTVLDCDFSKLKLNYSWTSRGYVKEVIVVEGSGSGGTQRVEISDEKFWEELEAAADMKGKEEVISNTLRQVLSSILRLDGDEEIDSHQNFQDLGLDSLMMVELKNILQRLLGTRVILTADQMSDCNTIYLLTQKLSELLFEDDKIILSPEELRAHILQESILPDEIQPSGGLSKLEDVSVILLTQPKSIFAPYLLENLCKRSQIKTVYCILPKENSEIEKQKFLDGLQARGLLEGIDMNKVKFIHGKGGDSKFGMESEAYDSLAIECDAVICTSLDKDSDDSLLIKKEGEEIKRILEFATQNKSKWVFHSSGLFPLGKASEGEEGRVLSEAWPQPQNEDIESYQRMGYSGSKFVSDRLFAQAAERGIPCKVFRIPYLAGDTRSGYFELTENHIFLRFMSYIQIGMMPTVPMPFSLLPVDFCAEIVLKIFLESPSAPLGLYNLTNPHNYSYKDFINVSEEYGHPIRAVELEDFFNEMGKNNSIIEVMTHRYGDMLDYKEHGKFENLTHLPEQEVSVSRLVQVIPNYLEMNETPLDTLKRDLKYAHEVGLFKKYGV